jgi:hypothetical protein
MVGLAMEKPMKITLSVPLRLCAFVSLWFTFTNLSLEKFPNYEILAKLITSFLLLPSNYAFTRRIR